MSTIDERVVSMKFDNAQFQKNAADTVTSLGKLKQSLNFEGAAKGLQSIDLSRLGTAADTIQKRFEGMNTVVTGILIGLGAQITNLGINAARDFGSSLIEGAREGFGEYETQINAVQTIMSNTASKGTTMEQVNQALDELNHYADKTIYNFSEMSRNIGTFTAAGVDLDTSTAAIKGIANLAAMSGSNSAQASTAMYQLSQALASGRVSLMDWNSVVNAGMGGEVFQTALKDTARAHGIAVDDIIAKQGSFRESLQEGWITAEVLTETLSKFTGDLTKEQILSMGYTEAQAEEILKLGTNASDAATKIKTFSQLMGSLKEAVSSGWAASWEIILGDFEEAKFLFTEISDRVGEIIGESTRARNEQLQIWKDLGGRTAIIDALRNAFDAVMQIVVPIRNAFRDVFPPTMGKTLAAISFALRDFTEGLKIGENGSKALYTVFKTVFTGIKFVVDLVSGAVRILFDNIGIGLQFMAGLIGLLSPVVTFLANLATGGEAADNRIAELVDRFIEMRQAVVGPLIEALNLAGDAIDEFLNGDPSRFADMWKAAMKPLVDLGGMLRERYANVAQALETTFQPVGERIADNWRRVLEVIQAVWDFLKKVGQAIGEFFAEFGTGFAEIFNGADFDTVLAAINTGVIVAVVLAIRKAFKSITSIFEAAGSIGKGITDALEGVTGVLKGMQANLKAEALLKIAGAIGILAISLLALSLIDPGRLQQAAITMGVISAAVIGILIAMERLMAQSSAVGSWSDTLKGSFTSIGDAVKQNLQASALIKAATALLIFAGAVALLAIAIGMLGAMKPDALIKGLIGVTVAIGLLVGAALLLDKMKNSIIGASVAMVIMAGAITAIAGAVAIFGMMPIDVLVQGGIAVAAVLVGLVGAAMLLSKFAQQMILSAVGLMAMAAALNMLIIPITAFGLIPFPVLMQGMIVLGVALLMLVAAAQAISGLGPGMAIAAVGLMAMAAAINQLMIPITVLGSMDLPTLIQGMIGLAAAMAILVIAANAMTGALPGAGAMILMAGAIVILSTAILILGSMPVENMIQGLLGIAAAIAILAVAGLLLAPVIPAMFAIAAAVAVLGVGLVLMAGAVLVFAFALAMLGPAIMSATAGLAVFAQHAEMVASAVPAMLAVGAGLIVFGAGAAVAGAGILVLGVGLIALGAGLALIGAVGIIGAVALAAVIKSMSKLTEHIPAMLLLTPTFIAFGAAVLVLGAGLLVLAAGALLTATALMLLIPLGGLVSVALNLVMKAIERAADKAPAIEALAAAMSPLGSSIQKVGSAGSAAASGIMAASIALVVLAASTVSTAGAITAMVTVIAASVAMALTLVGTAGTAFRALVQESLNSVRIFSSGISAAVPAVTAAASRLARGLTSTVVNSVRGSQGAMSGAGYSVGIAVTQGMSNGIQNGSYAVTAAARAVAARALAASKAELGVASPSKEYAKIGNWMDEGMADGQIKNVHKVETASEKVGKAALDSMRESLRGMKGAVATDMTLQPTIRPVIDLSAAKQGASQLGSMFKVPQLKLDNTRIAAASTQTSVDRVRENQQPFDDGPDTPGGTPTSVTFVQNNYSPKAISPTESYRQGQNLISRAKEEIAKK